MAKRRDLSPVQLDRWLDDMEPSSGQPFHIAIIGGGIGGLCTVLELDHHCKDDNITVDVYEQAAQYAEIGAGVGIGPNAAKLLHHIGIGDQVNAIAGRRQGVWFSWRRYDNGEDILTVPIDDNQKIRQAPMHRADFLDLLLDTVRLRVAATLHTKKECIKVVDTGEKVKAIFRDGASAEAGLIIACDGIHSTIRSQYIPSCQPIYSGRIAYRGLIPISDIEEWWPFPSYSIGWLGPGRHFIVYPISRNKTLNIAAFVATPESELGGLKESWTSDGDRGELAKDFHDFDDVVGRLIALLPERPKKWVLNDREPLPQWTFCGGRVVLMGDAAHPMLPHQGAGAGQAIEDAHILARAIHDFLSRRKISPIENDDHQLADYTHLYQATRLPRASAVQSTTRGAGYLYDLQTDDLMGQDLENPKRGYEACLPVLKEHLRDRMRWVWSGDVDEEYETEKKELGLWES